MGIWTKSAMARLDELYAEGTGKFALPENVMTNADISRLINSDEVQSVVNAPKEATKKLNPYAKTAKALAAKKTKAKKTKVKDVGKKFYKTISADSDYQGVDFEVFSKWLEHTDA